MNCHIDCEAEDDSYSNLTRRQYVCDDVLFRVPHRTLYLGSLGRFSKWWSISLAGGTAALGFGADAWPLAVTWALMCAGLPAIAMRAAIHKREFELEGQLVAAARGLSNAVKAGLPVHQGLASVVEETQAPLRGVLDQIVYHYEHGRPLAEILKESRKRLSLEPFTLFCLALEVSLERGGRVNQSLDRLASSLQEWHKIRRKLDSETASGRYAVLLPRPSACCSGFQVPIQ